MMTENYKAHEFLYEGANAMAERAKSRDAEGGERSMASTVAAFNALTGHKLSEEEGWEFMILLKLVRGRQGGFRADDYVDGAAYCGLLGEAAAGRRQTIESTDPERPTLGVSLTKDRSQS